MSVARAHSLEFRPSHSHDCQALQASSCYYLKSTMCQGLIARKLSVLLDLMAASLYILVPMQRYSIWNRLSREHVCKRYSFLFSYQLGP